MTTINLQSLERHPRGDELVAYIDDTRITIDTRGQPDVTVEDTEEVARVMLDDDYSVADVDVLGEQ